MQTLNSKFKLSRICAFCILIFIVSVGHRSLYGVTIVPLSSQKVTNKYNRLLPKIPKASVDKMEQKANQAIFFSATGVAMVLGVVLILSFGTMTGALPLLGIAGLFANIGFIKAYRLRSQTRSRRKTFFKARKNAKTAIILACVLGITLIIGLLSLLVDQPKPY